MNQKSVKIGIRLYQTLNIVLLLVAVTTTIFSLFFKYHYLLGYNELKIMLSEIKEFRYNTNNLENKKLEDLVFLIAGLIFTILGIYEVGITFIYIIVALFLLLIIICLLETF